MWSASSTLTAAAAQRLMRSCSSLLAMLPSGSAAAAAAASRHPGPDPSRHQQAGHSRASMHTAAVAATSSSVPGASGRRPVVAVAMSGGVDSSVAALLLKQQGFEVFGIFMHTWDAGDEAGAGSPICTAERDLADAQAVADKLGIPLLQLDVVSKYWTLVFEEFLAGLSQGLTPNPDLACNNAIKFGALLGFAQEQGADVLATGHYARLQGSWLQQQAEQTVPCEPPAATHHQHYQEGAAPAAGVQLLRATDTEKDQTYFLASLTAQQLERVAFPVGHLLKPQVRAIAAAEGLAPSEKRSSAGICFVGRRNFAAFLESYLAPQPGVYVDLETQQALGQCSNMLAVTSGQRARLGGLPEPYFVAGKHVAAGVVWVAKGHDHPALFSQQLLLGPPSWVSGKPPTPLQQEQQQQQQHSQQQAPPPETTAFSVPAPTPARFSCQAKARYRQPSVPCEIASAAAAHAMYGPFIPCQFHQSASQQLRSGAAGNGLVVQLEAPQRGLTPGQAFVMYDGNVCLGSATLMVPGITQWELAARGP